MDRERGFRVDGTPNLVLGLDEARAAGRVPDVVFADGTVVGDAASGALHTVDVSVGELQQLIDAKRLPRWVIGKGSYGPGYVAVRALMRDQALTTVCEEAACPNISRCWSRGTATFMIAGDHCTRGCRFCNVVSAKPLAPPDPDEPARVAEAAAAMGLRFVVVTAVARDDIPDGGAAHFVATIAALRERLPQTKVEVLIPDLRGNWDALDAIIEAAPDVLNHNTETVPRLYKRVRPGARYERTLELLERTSAAGLRAKSGIMVGWVSDSPRSRRSSRTWHRSGASWSRWGSTCARRRSISRSSATTPRPSTRRWPSSVARWVSVTSKPAPWCARASRRIGSPRNCRCPWVADPRSDSSRHPQPVLSEGIAGTDSVQTPGLKRLRRGSPRQIGRVCLGR